MNKIGQDHAFLKRKGDFSKELSSHSLPNAPNLVSRELGLVNVYKKNFNNFNPCQVFTACFFPRIQHPWISLCFDKTREDIPSLIELTISN